MILSKRVIIAATIVAMGVFSCTDDLNEDLTQNNVKTKNLKSEQALDNDRDSSANEIDAELMLSLINQVRAEGCNCGDTYMEPVPALEWNSQAEEAATAHTVDMAENSFMGHSGSDGSSAGDRLRRAGYSYRTWGENVAQGQRTEEDVMNSWLNSAGHCRNIMNPNFTHVGAAKVTGETQCPYPWFCYPSIYWTQVFAAPR